PVQFTPESGVQFAPEYPVMAGVGIGLIIGGMVGYVSKGSAIKADQKKKEFKQLQKDKEDLEKQAAEIAKREAELQAQNNNPQI
ncbi:MAG: hypothetical protein WCJ72_16320, partial [Chryseobacterium sp.]